LDLFSCRNFVDIVATEYRPGFIRLGGNDFVISVSLPVITLADSIPPRALMAWDRRLLASSQHLTLLITGFHGLYPVLENDASYSSSAQRLGVGLTFKVGLSKNYKPGNEHVQEVVRKHGLILQDAEDELRIQAEIAAQRAKMYDWDAENEEDEQMQPDVVVEEEPEVDDSGQFDRFSLSSSLESLMDQSFLKIVKLRRKFSLGWAGAEFLDAEVEKSQWKEEDIFAAKEKVIFNFPGSRDTFYESFFSSSGKPILTKGRLPELQVFHTIP
jgi:ubiquitin-conjugating enzyme E2 Q